MGRRAEEAAPAPPGPYVRIPGEPLARPVYHTDLVDEYLPLFARLYGIKPWDIGRLSVAEFYLFKRDADAWLAKTKDG